MSLNKAKRHIRALERGQFHKVLEDVEGWYKFVQRQASIPHTELVVLRLDSDGWYLWVTYKIVQNEPDVRLALDGMFIPSEDKHLKSKPEELEGLAVFEA